MKHLYSPNLLSSYLNYGGDTVFNASPSPSGISEQYVPVAAVGRRLSSSISVGPCTEKFSRRDT